ncbi:FtsX-like permease family protein [Imperialibacter roseus]|uniref:FtsX-like permease family protein n=1 Tax=Imperialibacter roseus TaxID=1324217 RepID=A0ABZ0IXP1_9BACT|nr:FtsX-like permease family protein [Imperialibacter roseus]WOK08407.1 FtsX-like permease family protein [Imperialibacter roseus]
MLKNHILLAFRHLKKEKGYALVSIMGLAIAFTVSFFAVVFLLHELFPDQHFAQRDRLYRMNSHFTLTEDRVLNPDVSFDAAFELGEKIPELEQVIPIDPVRGPFNISFGGETFKVDKCIFTSPEFTELFKANLFSVQLPFQKGSILLSNNISKAIFGEADPVGQIVNTSRGDFVVAGTFDDFPSNSHIQINAAAISLSSQSSGSGFVYVKFQEGATLGQVDPKLAELSGELEEQYGPFAYSLESIDEKYFSGTTGFIFRAINKNALQLLVIISGIILLISITNIVNYTQLKALFRGREVGVKKVLGIKKTQLVYQFFVESFLIVSVSFLLAMSMAQVFASEVYMYLKIVSVNQSLSLAVVAGVALGVAGLLTLPQIYLFTGIMPRKIISGNYKIGSKKHLSKAMIGAQFLITTGLVGGALLVRSQVSYIANKPLGFDADGLWYVHSDRDSLNLQLLKNEVKSIPGVISSTVSSAIPGQNAGYYLTVYDLDKHREQFFECKVDRDYFDTYRIHFKEEPTSLTATGYLLNEQGVWLEKELNGRFKIEGTLEGVVSDFHKSNLRQPIQPLRFRIRDQGNGFLTVRIAEGKEKEAKQYLAAKWKQLYPETPFELFNLKDQFVASHASVMEFLTLVNALTFISVFISCVGLSALSAFSIKKKIKEVAIRKVLGATVYQIAKSVNLGFVLIIAACALAAVPIVNKFGNDWMDGFAYHTRFHWWIQLLPGLLVLAVSVSIVTFKTWVTAKSNPIEALRTE